MTGLVRGPLLVGAPPPLCPSLNPALRQKAKRGRREMSPIPLGGVGSRRAGRPRTPVSKNKYYTEYVKIYRPITKLKF